MQYRLCYISQEQLNLTKYSYLFLGQYNLMIKFINEIVPKICTSINCQIFICVLREYETPNYKSHISDALTPYPSWD